MASRWGLVTTSRLHTSTEHRDTGLVRWPIRVYVPRGHGNMGEGSFGCEPQAFVLTKLSDLSDHGGVRHMVRVNPWRSPGRRGRWGRWGRRRHSQRGLTPWMLSPGPALFVAAKGSLSLVAIEMRVVTCGHKGLAIVWVTEVPIPDAVDDRKHLRLVRIVGGSLFLPRPWGDLPPQRPPPQPRPRPPLPPWRAPTPEILATFLKQGLLRMLFKRKVEAFVKSFFVETSFLMTARGTLSSLPLIPCKN